MKKKRIVVLFLVIIFSFALIVVSAQYFFWDNRHLSNTTEESKVNTDSQIQAEATPSDSTADDEVTSSIVPADLEKNNKFYQGREAFVAKNGDPAAQDCKALTPTPPNCYETSTYTFFYEGTVLDLLDETITLLTSDERQVEFYLGVPLGAIYRADPSQSPNVDLYPDKIGLEQVQIGSPIKVELRWKVGEPGPYVLLLYIGEPNT